METCFGYYHISFMIFMYHNGEYMHAWLQLWIDGWEDNQCNLSQLKWWDHSYRPRSIYQRNWNEIRRSLYEKESDEQCVSEDADL